MCSQVTRQLSLSLYVSSFAILHQWIASVTTDVELTDTEGQHLIWKLTWDQYLDGGHLVNEAGDGTSADVPHEGLDHGLPLKNQDVQKIIAAEDTFTVIGGSQTRDIENVEEDLDEIFFSVEKAHVRKEHERHELNTAAGESEEFVDFRDLGVLHEGMTDDDEFDDAFAHDDDDDGDNWNTREIQWDNCSQEFCADNGMVLFLEDGTPRAFEKGFKPHVHFCCSWL